MRLRPLVLGFLLLAAVAVALPSDAPLAHPKGYICYRAPSPIVIDGKLDDKAWAAAPWSDDFVDIVDNTKPKPRHRTRMKMLWDDEALYIAAELEEPHVWATHTKHDAVIFDDPDFEVFLDPDGDNHLYGELELNAKNTTWDLLLPKPYKDGGPAIDGWEIIGLKTAVHVDGTLNDPRDTDKGWTVEIKWPWASVKELTRGAIPPKDGDQMRINFSRVEWDFDIKDGKYVKIPKRPEHNWVWSPQGTIDMHRPERWGYVQFSTAKPGTAAFKPDEAAPVRDALHRVYYAQREYYKTNKKYAKTTAELGLKDEVKIETTTHSFEASMMMGKKRGTIREDSRIVVQ